MSKRWTEEEGSIVAEPAAKQKTKEPARYRVLLHNDNYTTMDFVVMILVDVFHKSQPDAVRIMLDVHRKGMGVVGSFSREVAETKVARVTQLARKAEFPLLCTMEPE
jgi:ATP-dependent Clp protease adaptor protein ClpS